MIDLALFHVPCLVVGLEQNHYSNVYLIPCCVQFACVRQPAVLVEVPSITEASATSIPRRA